MRAALYARVSTERQADRGTIGSQLSLLREHIAAAGDELVGEYVDDGHSGARLDRPGLDALRDAAEAGLIERVWCLSPDRLARAYAYQVLVLDELDRFGVAVAFTDSPGLAADDPQATLLTQVQGVIAEYEKAKIAERYRRGKLFGPAPARSSPGRLPTATAAFPAAPPPAKPTTRSTSPRPPWCGGSSPTAPRASPCARSADASTPTQHHRRPANPPGATPRSAGCCATRPTSAGSTTTAPNRCPTGAPPAATGRSRATGTNGSPSTAPGSSPMSCSRPPAESPPTTPSGARAAPTRPVAAQRTCQMRCLRRWHQLPQDARPQRDLAPLLLLPQPRPHPRRRRTRRCPERNIRADALDAFVFDHIRAAITHPDQLLAGEQAVTLTTPIPDDELLSAELARLDRKLEAADTERRRLVDLYQGGFIEIPEMQRRATEISPAEKSCSTSEPASPTNEPRSPVTTSSAAASTTSPPASTPSSTPSTTSKNNSCCACSSKTSGSPAGTSRSGSASRSTRHHPTRPAQQAHRHHTRTQCQAKTVYVPLVLMDGPSYPPRKRPAQDNLTPARQPRYPHHSRARTWGIT